MDRHDQRPHRHLDMDINDRSFRPPQVAEVRVVPSTDVRGRPEYRLRAANGTESAVLAPLDGNDRSIAFEDVQDLHVPVDGCWEMTVVDAGGDLVENRILFGGRRAAPDESGLRPDVEAWAKLTVVSAFGGKAGGQG